jgi:hypothetical protein
MVGYNHLYIYIYIVAYNYISPMGGEHLLSITYLHKLSWQIDFTTQICIEN